MDGHGQESQTDHGSICTYEFFRVNSDESLRPSDD